MADWKRISEDTVQKFIFKNEHADERELVLQHKALFDLPTKSIAEQIAGRRKAKKKLPFWYETKGVVYPPTLNLEQSSSQATALFKAKIAETFTGIKKNAGVDLTGGFGVDSFFLARLFDSFHYIEPDGALIEIAQHNHSMLKAANIKHHLNVAEQFIDQNNLDFDLVFVDPSRRDNKSRKIIRLADCLPDITQLQQRVLNRSKFLLIKTSPLLDIKQGLREVDHVRKVYVVSVDNECKELLFLAEQNYEGEISIEAIDLLASGNARSSFLFTPEEEKASQVSFGEPQNYLYEPNASILKAGAFKLISERFQLKKLAANTHLYTANKLILDFPGRIFSVEVLNPEPRQLPRLLPNRQVNVVTRNYPLSVQEIKKKLNLNDGGDKFFVGFSSEKKKHLALCARITNSK